MELVLSADQIMRLQQLVRRVPVSRDVVDYSVKLVRATRPHEEGTPQFIRDLVSWGAGPRASQFLVLGAKTRAILDGRYTPNSEDVRSVALATLRHRIVTNFHAEAEGVSDVDIVDRLVREVAPATVAS
jgi:MoxR-like ATPase